MKAMCNLGEAVAAMGREQGIEQGAELNLLENIKNLMETMNLTAERAMDALKVPEEKRQKFKDML